MKTIYIENQNREERVMRKNRSLDTTFRAENTSM
jgi:hypothetical protein